MLALALLTILSTPAERWTGEFTFIIKGEGTDKGKFNSTASWKVHREARGTYTLDRLIRGSVIAGSPDNRNETRYASWLPNLNAPFRLKINDRIQERSPLFNPNEIRSDVQTYSCPPAPSDDMNGRFSAGALQIDATNGTYTVDFPPLRAKTHMKFRRDFVSGPPNWMAKKPIIQEETDVAYDMFSNLLREDQWWLLRGKFAPGQTEIRLSRKFPRAFRVSLSGLFREYLAGELVLVLKKEQT